MRFYPPNPSPIAAACGRLVIFPALSVKYGILGVDIGEEDIARLKALRGRRALLAPNHPSPAEPAILFALSKRAGEPFHYVCCREMFDRCFGLWGRYLQRVGAYSIVRGVVDRESFHMTRRLLCRPGMKLVLFPEGEIYSQNDTLLPFHSGVAQLMFWALEDLRKQEPDGSLYILPIAIKYRFLTDMEPAIAASLTRLEKALALRNPGPYDYYARLRRIGNEVLTAIERDYGLKPGTTVCNAGAVEDDDMNERISAVKEAIVDRVASALYLNLRSENRSLSRRMRTLINAVNTVTRDEPPIRSAYEARLHAAQRERAIPLLHDLDRLANLIAIQDGYVGEVPSPERTADTLRRLETEVLGRPYCTGPRRCRLRIGEPFDLTDHYAAYTADKRTTVSIVTERMETAVQALLDGMPFGEPSRSRRPPRV